MKYKGIELKEFKSDKPVVFNPAKRMLVWDDWTDEVRQELVIAYLPSWDFPAIITNVAWRHCAEIPEIFKTRRATNIELAKWLAQGNGLYKRRIGDIAWSYVGHIDEDAFEDECNTDYLIRKWDDTEWHEPTADYMGLEE